MYSYGPPHMAGQKEDDQLEHTYSNFVRIRDATRKTFQRPWPYEKSTSILATWDIHTQISQDWVSMINWYEQKNELRMITWCRKELYKQIRSRGHHKRKKTKKKTKYNVYKSTTKTKRKCFKIFWPECQLWYSRSVDQGKYFNILTQFWTQAVD